MKGDVNMKINGEAVIGEQFAYDGCHKIYIIEDLEDKAEAIEDGYMLLPINQLEEAYENSCGLKFISNWSLTKKYVAQFEEADFE